MCSVYPPPLLPPHTSPLRSVCPTCSTRRVEPTSRFSAHAVAQPVRSRPSPCSTSFSHTIPSMIPRVSLSAATTARGRQRLELAVLTLFIFKRRMFQKRSVASDVTEVKAVIAVAQCRSRFWLSTFGATTCSTCLHDSFSDDSFLSTPHSGQVSSVSLLERPTAHIARLGYTSIAQQNAYTCSLAGMFKGYAMSQHLAQTCDSSSVYPHTTLAVPDACAPFGAERRLLRRRLMIDHFPTVSLQVPHVHVTAERLREHPARDV